MDLLKTPHQKLLEEAGASPLPSPGMMKTPKQMLFEEAGMLPKFNRGGKLKPAQQYLSPQQMQAAMIINGKTPARFAPGGAVSKALDYGLKGLLFGPDTIQGAAKVAKGKPLGALENAVNIGTYMLPIAPMAGVMAAAPSELGDDTLQGFADQANQPETKTDKFTKWLLSLGAK